MLTEVRCTECDEVTLVREIPATRIDPGYPDRDTCEHCGADLDFEQAEPVDPRDFEPDAFDAAGER